MDFQHRAGGKTGSGGVASWSDANVDRRERLRQLAMETIDLNKVLYCAYMIVQFIPMQSDSKFILCFRTRTLCEIIWAVTSANFVWLCITMKAVTWLTLRQRNIRRICKCTLKFISLEHVCNFNFKKGSTRRNGRKRHAGWGAGLGQASSWAEKVCEDWSAGLQRFGCNNLNLTTVNQQNYT